MMIIRPYFFFLLLTPHCGFYGWFLFRTRFYSLFNLKRYYVFLFRLINKWINNINRQSFWFEITAAKKKICLDTIFLLLHSILLLTINLCFYNGREDDNFHSNRCGPFKYTAGNLLKDKSSSNLTTNNNVCFADLYVH